MFRNREFQFSKTTTKESVALAHKPCWFSSWNHSKKKQNKSIKASIKPSGLSVIVTTTFEKGQGLDMFSEFVSFQGMFTTQTTTAFLVILTDVHAISWSLTGSSHVCQRLVSSGGQMEVQIYPPLWTVSLGGLVGHNSHRKKQVNSGYKCYRWSWKQMAFNHCGWPDLLLHRKKHGKSWIPYLWPLREIQRESKRVWQAHSNRVGCVGLNHQTSSPPVELKW